MNFFRMLLFIQIYHPLHCNSTILNSLNILTFSSRRIDADFRFVRGLLDASIDALDLFFSNIFRGPTYPSNHMTSRLLFIILLL